MAKSLFNPEILERAVMSDIDAARFRELAQLRVVTDEASQQRVVFYVHPDGRILLDAIRPAPVEHWALAKERARSALSKFARTNPHENHITSPSPQGLS